MSDRAIPHKFRKWDPPRPATFGVPPIVDLRGSSSMKSRVSSNFALLLLAVLAYSIQSARAQSYSVTDLGSLGGGTSSAHAINSAGEVVGGSWTSRGAAGAHAFLYASGRMIDLGTLGGEFSTALGINNSGEIVGYSTLSDGTPRGFVSSGGRMTALGMTGAARDAAYAINDSGALVAEAYSEAGLPHSFLLGGGQTVDLGKLVGNVSEESMPAWLGINASG